MLSMMLHSIKLNKFDMDIQDKTKEELVSELQELLQENNSLKVLKEKRASELGIANIELDFQEEEEKEKRADELIIAKGKAEKCEIQFRTIFEESSLGIALIDSYTGKFKEVNPMFSKIVGRTIEKMNTIDWMSITHPDDIQSNLDNMALMNAGKTNGFQMDKRYILPNGEYVYVNMTIAPITIADKSNPHHLCMIKDITERKQAEGKIKTLSKAIEQGPSSIVITNVEGKIEFVNDKFTEVTQYQLEDVRGKNPRIFNPGRLPENEFETLWETLQKGNTWKGEVLNRRKDKFQYWEEVSVSAVMNPDGTISNYILIMDDITEKKQMLEDLIAANKELAFQNEEKEKRADELIIANKDLIQAKEYAKHLASAKDQFLANMSHEIRTPLNGIIGFTKILLRNGITEKQKHQLSAIKTSSDILLVLINDILDLAKIEAGKMALETTELKISDLVNSVISTFELRIEEKEFKLNKQYDKRIPQILIGDPVRINQILLNLLSNAEKFTHQGEQISISINLLKQDEEKTSIEFIVSDTGIGIPADKLATIFEPFMQSSSDTTRKYGGTGLGLSIVKRLVDLMGGTISVKSKLNEGSAFTFTLPLKKTTATEVSKEKKSVILTDGLKQLGKLKILLAEDIPVNQFLAETILHDFGFESDTAENGKIAIELLEKNNYDIILMDLQMPEMNGWEATQHIRSKMQPPKSTIPIIALTADVIKRDTDKCKELGMDEYVSKPINETDLLNKIVRLIKEKRKPLLISPEGEKPTADQQTIKSDSYRICNLDYLKSHSLNNPKFVKEMIQMLLKQTPVIIEQINKCLSTADWNGLHGNVHKMKPSLDLIGLPKDITVAALQMEEYAREQEHLDLIPSLLLKLEKALEQAFKELEEELTIKS